MAWILEIQEEALLEDLHMLRSVRTNQNRKRPHTHTFIQTFLLSICRMPQTEDTGVNETKFPALGS